MQLCHSSCDSDCRYLMGMNKFTLFAFDLQPDHDAHACLHAHCLRLRPSSCAALSCTCHFDKPVGSNAVTAFHTTPTAGAAMCNGASAAAAKPLVLAMRCKFLVKYGSTAVLTAVFLPTRLKNMSGPAAHC